LPQTQTTTTPIRLVQWLNLAPYKKGYLLILGYLPLC
jgi:hypothetical protein